ncbi:hypothetical protein DZD52_00130 [Xanthomonas nasturtii]|uniref:Uncharacterized protein n=1 Tax=Xanthomonas nasturtii TaxID=1843581 RepID=A0A3E1KT51_9XANT|nr:hypothetical protein DZD52_00130 [Xanthomonas nasturtii]
MCWRYRPPCSSINGSAWPFSPWSVGCCTASASAANKPPEPATDTAHALHAPSWQARKATCLQRMPLPSSASSPCTAAADSIDRP